MRRYVLAGASSRALHMYALPVLERYRDSASLVGIWDVNSARAEYISGPHSGLTLSGISPMLAKLSA